MTLTMEPILDAMQGALEAHSWSGVSAPEFVRKGPVVPGDLELPSIGIIEDEAEDRGGSLAEDRYLVPFRWQLGKALDCDSPDVTLAELLAYRDNMKAVALSAVDERWGLPDVVDATQVGAWRVFIEPGPVPTGVLELSLEIPVHAPYPVEDTVMVPYDVSLQIYGTFFRILAASLPAYGRIGIRIYNHPAMTLVGEGWTNWGTMVSGAFISGLSVGNDYVANYTTEADAEGWQSQSTWWIFYGPWKQPPRGDPIQGPIPDPTEP